MKAFEEEIMSFKKNELKQDHFGTTIKKNRKNILGRREYLCCLIWFER